MRVQRIWAVAALAAAACTTSLGTLEGLSFPCTRDAGVDPCTGGWTCGLDGHCHAATPGPYACASEGDCNGWHCGLDQICVDLSVPGPFACDFSSEQAGTRHDCATLWRCGREDVCHAVGAAAPYLCSGDLDCEAQWLCAGSGRCVSADETAPVPSPDALRVERISPLVLDHRPDLVAIDQDRVSWTYGAQLGFVERTYEHVTLPAVPDALSSFGGWTWVMAGGGVTRYAFEQDGGPPIVQTLDAGFAVRGLSHGKAYVGDYLVLIGSTRALVASEDGQLNLTPSIDGGQIIDLSAFSVVYTTNALLAATTTGLVACDLTAAGCSAWRVLPIRDSDYHPWPYRPPEALRGNGRGELTLLYPDAGQSLVLSFEPGVYTTLVIDESTGTCPLCAGATWVETELTEDEYWPTSRCRAGDHDFVERSDPRFGGCPVPPDGGLDVMATSDRSADRGITAHGVMRYSPSIALGPDDRTAPSSGGEAAGLPVLTTGPYLPSFGVGSWGLPGNLNPATELLGSLRGRASWAWSAGSLADVSTVNAGGAPVCIGTLFSAGKAPQSGAAQRLEDGGVRVALDDNGLILIGEPQSPDPDSGAECPALEPLAVASNGIPSTSLAWATAPADAGWVGLAYALSRTQLTQVTGTSSLTWSSASVDTPLGDRVGLLGDEAHTRVAYTDGRVYSLPNLFSIAGPLPDATPVSDVANVDGVDLAVTDAGLFALAPAPDGGAFWRSVAVPPSTLDPVDIGGDFAATAFIRGEHAVYLLTRYGTVYRITLPAGTP